MRDLALVTLDWAKRAFGVEHTVNKRVRALRLAEEAVELAQALGVQQQQAHQLVDMVYARPVGQPLQELGGVMMTAVVLADALGTDLHAALRRELLRVLAKPPEHFAQRNQQKLNMGMS